MKQNDPSGDPRSAAERFSSLTEQPANWGQNVSARYIKTLLQDWSAETAALSVNTRRGGQKTHRGRSAPPVPPPRGSMTELLVFTHGRRAHGRRSLDLKQGWSRSGWICVSISRGWSQRVELPPEISLRPTSTRATADLPPPPPTTHHTKLPPASPSIFPALCGCPRFFLTDNSRRLKDSVR